MIPALCFGALPPHPGGELTLLVADPMALLDPAQASTMAERQVASLVTEPLFKTDGRNLEGLLALRWNMEEDGAAFRIMLKPNVSFHDGSKLRAGDVRASFERILKSSFASPIHRRLLPIKGAGGCHSGSAERLDGFEEVSPYEFVIRLERPDPGFLHRLADPGLAVIPERMAGTGASIRRPIGTGPFSLASASGRTVILEAYSSCHAGRPYLDRIVFRRAENAEEERQALKFGKVDGVLSGRLESFQGARTAFGLTGSEVVFRAVSSRFSGKRVKLASFLHALIDCETVVGLFERRVRAPFKTERKSGGLKTSGVVAAGSDFKALRALAREAVGESCAGYKPDAGKARDAFDKLAGGEALTLGVREDRPELILIAERISLIAADIGISLSVKTIRAEEVLRVRKDGLVDLELMEQPSFHFPDDLKKAPFRTVSLYRLPPRVLWGKSDGPLVEFDIWGNADLASAWRRAR